MPARIRQPDNDTGEFHRQLKSFCDTAAHSDFLLFAPLNTLTLLTHSLICFNGVSVFMHICTVMYFSISVVIFLFYCCYFIVYCVFNELI